MKQRSQKRVLMGLGVLAVAILLFVIIGKLQQSFLGSGCNLGSWNVKSYDIAQGRVVIGAGIGVVHSAGCLGSYDVHNKGIPAIQNQLDCEEIGFTWRQASEIPDGGFPCYLGDPQWSDGKTYSSTVFCSHTSYGCCAPPDGSAGVSCGAICAGKNQLIDHVSPGFDGTSLSFPDMKRQNDDTVSCSGDITISFTPESQEVPEESILPGFLDSEEPIHEEPLPDSPTYTPATPVPAATPDSQNPQSPSQANQGMGNAFTYLFGGIVVVLFVIVVALAVRRFMR